MGEKKIVKAPAKKEKASVDTNEISDVIKNLTSHVTSNPNIIKELKENPIQAIAGFLGDQNVSEDTKKHVNNAVKKSNSNDLGSIVGALGSLFGSNEEDAASKHEEHGNPLEGLMSALGGGGLGNIMGLLGGAFGGKSSQKKDESPVEEVMDLVGSLFGSKK